MSVQQSRDLFRFLSQNKTLKRLISRNNGARVFTEKKEDYYKLIYKRLSKRLCE